MAQFGIYFTPDPTALPGSRMLFGSFMGQGEMGFQEYPFAPGSAGAIFDILLENPQRRILEPYPYETISGVEIGSRLLDYYWPAPVASIKPLDPISSMGAQALVERVESLRKFAESHCSERSFDDVCSEVQRDVFGSPNRFLTMEEFESGFGSGRIGAIRKKTRDPNRMASECIFAWRTPNGLLVVSLGANHPLSCVSYTVPNPMRYADVLARELGLAMSEAGAYFWRALLQERVGLSRHQLARRFNKARRG